MDLTQTETADYEAVDLKRRELVKQWKHTQNVVDRVWQERNRQITLGYDPKHDDEHTNGEIADCAVSFIRGYAEFSNGWYTQEQLEAKPHKERLKIAAAMLIAEIERLERLEQPLESAVADDFNSSRA